MSRSTPRTGPHGFDLCGWPQILPLLGVGEDRARRLMRRADDPAPIVQWFGAVIAKRAELVAWAEREASRDGAVTRGRAST